MKVLLPADAKSVIPYANPHAHRLATDMDGDGNYDSNGYKFIIEYPVKKTLTVGSTDTDLGDITEVSGKVVFYVSSLPAIANGWPNDRITVIGGFDFGEPVNVEYSVVIATEKAWNLLINAYYTNGSQRLWTVHTPARAFDSVNPTLPNNPQMGWAGILTRIRYLTFEIFEFYAPQGDSFPVYVHFWIKLH